MPLMESIQQEALSKKLWISGRQDKPIIKREFPEFDDNGWGEHLTVGNISAAKFSYSTAGAPYVAGLIWDNQTDEILFKESMKQAESTDDWFANREAAIKTTQSFYRKMDSAVEKLIAKNSAASVDLPEDLLNALAPEISSIQIPETVRSSQEREEVESKINSMYLDAKKKFIGMLSTTDASLADAEISTHPIRAKKSKNVALKAFFEKVSPAFVDAMAKLKAAPLDRKKVVRDAATGFEIGEPVLIDHPKHGKIPGTVMGFKDGLVGVRHKNIDRQMRHYASVGTQDTYVEPSKVTSRKSYIASTSVNVINKVRKAILDLPDLQRVRKDTLDGFIKSISIDATGLADSAKKDGLNDKASLKRKNSEIYNERSRAPRSERGQLPSGYPGIKSIVHLNDDLSLDENRIKQDAELSTEEVMSAFLDRSASKIAPVIEKHGGLKEIIPFDLKYRVGILHGKVRVTFDNGDEFTTHSQLVWKTSILGKLFYQFPTTFNNVKFNGQNVSKPDEAWMNEVFAKSAPKQEDAAYEVRFQGWLEKNQDRLKGEYEQYRKKGGSYTMKFNDFALEKYLKKEASNGN